MPTIKIDVPKGLINESTKTKIIKYASHAMLKAEGLPNTKKSRSLVWCFFNELNQDAWCIGGTQSNELRFFIQISMFEKALNDTRKKDISESIIKILNETCKEKIKKENVWIIINGIPDNNFSTGGKLIGMNDLADFLNINPAALNT